MSQSTTKRAVFIIAKETFRDEELFETQKVLKDSGVETVVASSKLGTRIGKLGGMAEATILVGDIIVEAFDAIIFVGGDGAEEYFDSEFALGLAAEAVSKEKVLAAICIAPRILANAGLLKGIRATCYISQAEALKKAGALFQDTDVEREGDIVTASGPEASVKFGKIIAKALNRK